MGENDWRRFVEERQQAAAAEREELKKNPTSPQQAVAAALELLCLYEELHGNPFVKDAVTLQEEEQVRNTWNRLREAWPRGR